jgi:hypothetical protein
MRSARPLPQDERKVIRRLVKLEPSPVLTGVCALAAWSKLRPHLRCGVDLVWRDRGSLDEGFVAAVAEGLRERHYRCDDLGGDAAERRLRPTGPSFGRVEVRLLADPRPPAGPPLDVRFGELLVAVDDRRTILAGVLERLYQERDPERLFELDQCLRAGADLGTGVRDFAVRNPGADAWDLILTLRDFGPVCERAALSGASHLHYWRRDLLLFASRLQRRLLDFV